MNTTDLIEDLRLLSPPNYGVWLALGIAALMTLGFLLLIRRWIRRKQTDISNVSGPELWDVALTELEHLIPLIRRERSRDYAVQSTAILRRYIEARYSLRAPKLATEEFLALAKDSPTLPAEHRAGLGHFLELCDLLKFGRYLATATELEPLHGAAVAFVLASKPVIAASQRSEGPA